MRENGATVAAGAMAFGHGWASVHGMRTEQSQRGRGLAGRVLAGLAQAALALYRRAGFETRWQYCYWQRQQWPR